MLNVMQSSFGSMRTPRFVLKAPLQSPCRHWRDVRDLASAHNRGEELGFLTYCQPATDRLYNPVMLRIGAALFTQVVTT